MGGVGDTTEAAVAGLHEEEPPNSVAVLQYRNMLMDQISQAGPFEFCNPRGRFKIWHQSAY